MLHALGHHRIERYHMNEGHAALLGIALLERRLQSVGAGGVSDVDVETVRRKCVFTTHTPVPAGHDQFGRGLVRQVLGTARTSLLEFTGCCSGETLNMTYLALRLSHYVNGVTMRHGEISQEMFPAYRVDAITNGIHAPTWAAASFQDLYDRYIAGWRRDNLCLRYAWGIPLEDIRTAHNRAKQDLFDRIRRLTGATLDPAVMTLGFARRATAYKRADLLFADLERLRSIAHHVGRLQVVYDGKAHPRDSGGKEIIRRVFESARTIKDAIPVVYVEDYDVRWAQAICGGVDLWLNTPQKPQEASGTSGMKCALNGIPSLSVLDGWWIEGHIEGVTGWSIDDDGSDSLYAKLEQAIVPMYHQRPDAYAGIMRSTIALNASFFNAQRMIGQYLVNAYRVTAAGEDGFPS